MHNIEERFSNIIYMYINVYIASGIEIEIHQLLKDLRYLEFLFRPVRGRLPDLRARFQSSYGHFRFPLSCLTTERKEGRKKITKHYHKNSLWLFPFASFIFYKNHLSMSPVSTPVRIQCIFMGSRKPRIYWSNGRLYCTYICGLVSLLVFTALPSRL